MKKTLLITRALALAGALAAGQAGAADRAPVGVGGYMGPWAGMTNSGYYMTEAKSGDAWSASVNVQQSLGGANVNLLPNAAGGYGIFANRAAQAKEMLDAAMAPVLKSVEETTTTNIGLRVSFGAFGFNVAHAVIDRPATYEILAGNDVIVVTTRQWGHKGDGATAALAQPADADGPVNGLRMNKMTMAGKGDSTVTAVGVMYANGPIAVSLGYTAEERDSGKDAQAMTTSFRYTLTEGVESRTSIFHAEDDENMADSTGFVTGIVIGF